MYVAACCCGGDPGPVCDCFDDDSTVLGKISMVVSRRDAYYRHIDRCIDEVDDQVISRVETDYIECEIPVRCVGGTRYNTDFDDERPLSMKALRVKTDNRLQFKRFWQGFIPCDRIDRTSISGYNENVQAEDVSWPTETGGPSGVITNVLAGATTQIWSAAAFASPHANLLLAYENEYGEPFEIDPEKHYRVTRASLRYEAEVFVTDFDRVFENGQQVSSNDTSGDRSISVSPLGYISNQVVTVCSLDECDVRDFGSVEFSCLVGFNGATSILPIEFYQETVFVPPSTCIETPGYGLCPPIPAHPVDGDVQIQTLNMTGAVTGFEIESA